MPERTYTTHDIARFCDVVPSSVNYWIKQGELKAYNTPGGHNRVTRENLVSFLKEHRMPIPRELAERKRILIVDDERELCGVLEKAFGRHEAFATESSENPVDALIRIGQDPPALVILDILLPRMDGFQVCDILKAKPETRGIKIIAISGKKPQPSERKLQEHKIDAFFAKPLELADVVAKAAQLLRLELEPSAK